MPKNNSDDGPMRHETAAPVPASNPAAAPCVLLGVGLCFFLSGFAALLYQTAWLRQFSAVFGTSELAVATVLAAYMGGLAAGAALAGRLVHRIRRPVLVYGVLEAGIALSALAVPLLLLGTRAVYAALLGGQAAPPDAAAVGQPVFYLSVAFLVLALPTGLMGATLPVLTRFAVQRDFDVGPRIAMLYAINTAGAVAGTMTAAFLLLPALGLIATVWVGVTVNLLVFGIAAFLARALNTVSHSAATAAARVKSIGFASACVMPLLRLREPFARRVSGLFEQQPAWILPVMLISGANAFFYEVLWTRLLSHVLGASIYAFATMLAAFLTGIALGGGLAGKVATCRERASLAFALTQIAVAVLSIAVYQLLGPLIPEAHATASLVGYAIAVLLPATIFIGATFPLAVRVLAQSEAEASHATARVYAWNTGGAIVGAVAAGFFAIPMLGFEGSIALAVLINLALALWVAAFVAPRRVALVAGIAAAIVGSALLYRPSRPNAVVLSTGFPVQIPTAPREVFYAVGRSATVIALEEDGYYFLRTNGLPEASIRARGTRPGQDPERWLTALPTIARPDTQSMLVVGLGGGVALEGVPAFVESIDVVEIEPQVIAANRFLKDMRNLDPLADERFKLIVNDARNALRLTSKSYDVIVSQPSHPWTAGASHLYTREFIAEAKSHLNDDGVFVQWISSEFIGEELLRTLTATLLAEFEHVRLYQSGPQVLTFLASSTPLDPELALARTGRPLSTETLHFSYLGINSVEDLVAAFIMDTPALAEFAADAAISTDNDNHIATRSRTRADGLTPNDLFTLFAPHDALLDNDSWIYRQLATGLDFGYLARRLLSNGQQARAAALPRVITDPTDRYTVAGTIFDVTGQRDDARRAYTAALEANPAAAQARYALIVDRLGALSEELVASLTRDLPRSAAAVVRGWPSATAGDWLALARLDDDLATVNVTDAWYPEVAWLRALWRSNVAQDSARYANDALRLIDRALVLASEPRLYSLRALSASLAGNPDYVVESFRYLAALFRIRVSSGTPLPPAERASTLNSLTQMREQLQSQPTIADPGRAATVVADIEALIAQLETTEDTP